MSFSTISAGRLEAEPQVWKRISLRTGAATFRLVSQRVFHFFSDVSSWRHPSRSLANAVHHPDCVLAMFEQRGGWPYVQDDSK